MPSVPYKIRYANEAVDDVRGMRKFDQRTLLEGIKIQNPFDPSAQVREQEPHQSHGATVLESVSPAG